MEREGCSNCKHAQLVMLPAGETHGGVHASDTHINMYICHHRRAQHYGHIMLGDHSCLGFRERDDAK
ncbi:hypothetical protein ACFLX5_03540 [Chloroflexota bacterium]